MTYHLYKLRADLPIIWAKNSLTNCLSSAFNYHPFELRIAIPTVWAQHWCTTCLSSALPYHLFEFSIGCCVLLLQFYPLHRQGLLQLFHLLHSLMDLLQTDVQVQLLFLQVGSLLMVQLGLIKKTKQFSEKVLFFTQGVATRQHSKRSCINAPQVCLSSSQ